MKFISIITLHAEFLAIFLYIENQNMNATHWLIFIFRFWNLNMNATQWLNFLFCFCYPKMNATHCPIFLFCFCNLNINVTHWLIFLFRFCKHCQDIQQELSFLWGSHQCLQMWIAHSHMSGKSLWNVMMWSKSQAFLFPSVAPTYTYISITFDVTFLAY